MLVVRIDSKLCSADWKKRVEQSMKVGDLAILEHFDPEFHRGPCKMLATELEITFFEDVAKKEGVFVPHADKIRAKSWPGAI